jgi:nucleotide-binding universal stress UspA family protein
MANRSEFRADVGTLLFITNPANDNQELLEYASELAERRGVLLELLHIIDPAQAHSRPDAQMGIQYSLESLASNLRALKRHTRAHLLFGYPGNVIPKRADETRAILIALALDGSANDRIKRKLAQELAGKCACPVLMLSPFRAKAGRYKARIEEALHQALGVSLVLTTGELARLEG